MNNPVTNDRVTRWHLLLKIFNITIIDRLDKDNLVSILLSRLIHICNIPDIKSMQKINKMLEMAE
jgi:hypothetical protein